MIYLTEHQRKLDKLYNELNDLKNGKQCLEKALHQNFFNKDTSGDLYEKLKKINTRIKLIKEELEKEKENG